MGNACELLIVHVAKEIDDLPVSLEMYVNWHRLSTASDGVGNAGMRKVTTRDDLAEDGREARGVVEEDTRPSRFDDNSNGYAFGRRAGDAYLTGTTYVHYERSLLGWMRLGPDLGMEEPWRRLRQ